MFFNYFIFSNFSFISTCINKICICIKNQYSHTKNETYSYWLMKPTERIILIIIVRCRMMLMNNDV